MRLFVAVEVPPAVRAAVASAVAGLRDAAPRLRWVAPERYHLTLVFLGSVDASLLESVVAAVENGTRGTPGFDLSLDGRLGTFGRRVLWAGVADSPALSGLASSVKASLSQVVALPDGDRDFSAHLTLARAAREPVRPSLVAGAAVPPLSWRVDRVVVLRSADGYEVVSGVRLDAPDA